MNTYRYAWSSDEIRTNCFWWALRQYMRRGGYITARPIDYVHGPTAARLMFGLALFCFCLAPELLWPLGLLLAIHAPLFFFHWGWMPRHRRRLYHFRPVDAAIQVPWITLRGHIQLGEDDAR